MESTVALKIKTNTGIGTIDGWSVLGLHGVTIVSNPCCGWEFG